MSLINVENSQAIFGAVASVQVIKDGTHTFYVETGESLERCAYLALTYGNGKASNYATGAVAAHLDNLLTDTTSLYRVQAILNMPEWREVGFVPQVEFRVEIGDAWQTILVKPSLQ